MNQLSRNVRYLLSVHGMSPTQLSAATGVPQPTVHRIVSSISAEPRSSTLAPIAAFFCFTTDELRTALLTDLTDSEILRRKSAPERIRRSIARQMSSAQMPELLAERVRLDEGVHKAATKTQGVQFSGRDPSQAEQALKLEQKIQMGRTLKSRLLQEFAPQCVDVRTVVGATARRVSYLSSTVAAQVFFHDDLSSHHLSLTKKAAPSFMQTALIKRLNPHLRVLLIVVSEVDEPARDEEARHILQADAVEFGVTVLFVQSIDEAVAMLCLVEEQQAAAQPITGEDTDSSVH